VPRAKRTARADARRRYRATQNAPEDELDDLETTEDAPPPAKAAPAKAAASTTSAAQPRPSIAAAFRNAFRPVDLRGDLRALPRLLIDKAFLIPVAAMIAIAAVVLATGGKEIISGVLAPYFLYPPPIAAVFLSGFLAPRASWLLGGLIGLIQSVVTVVLAASLPSVAGGTAADAGLFAYSLAVSVGFGAFYAAAAAWYKRFLQGANPPRRAAGQPSKSSGQKGSSSSRPLLARKR
jgi:hypothetical protein